MASTLKELESFHRFATHRLAGSTSEPSLDELLMEWQDTNDDKSIHQAIQRGLDDVEAGRHEPAETAMEGIRKEFGFAKPFD